MPVTGVSKVKSNMRSAFKNISEKKAPEFIHALLSVGWAASKELTPIEYGTLTNSTTMWVEVTPNSVSGELMYNANYAAALEFGTWRPVAAVNKEGPADNMNAEPHFLRKGFESNESKTHIKQAEKIFKV